jgi:hypothetical protein
MFRDEKCNCFDVFYTEDELKEREENRMKKVTSIEEAKKITGGKRNGEKRK